MTGTNRLEGVYGPLAHFAGHSVGADLSMMCLALLWGVYRLLSNMAGN